jgi:type IV secretory pathway VirB10-like protein
MNAPRGVSKWYAIIVLSGIGCGLICILYALSHRPPVPTTTPAFHQSSGKDGLWFSKYAATAQPTQAPMRIAAAPYHPMSTPIALPPPPMQAQAYHTPHAQSTISEWERLRQREYLAALSSEIGVKQDNGQTLQTPQVTVSNPANSAIDVAPQPAPPHTLSAWSWIYATLATGIDSDHAGDVLGRVSQDVKDSVTQTETLIPMGSILHGTQKGRAQVMQNDTSLIVRWDDIELPNGAHIHIGDMPGADPAGYPGFNDEVDNHYGRTWTPALLISAITAGTMLASNPTYGSSNGYNAEQEAFGAGASRLGSFGQSQLMSQLVGVKPTLTIRPGYQFRVLVTKDIVFNQPYRQEP